MWQELLVGLIVAAAGFYMFRRFRRTIRPQAGPGGGCGCGCDGACQKAEDCAQKTVDLEIPAPKN